MGAFSFLCLPGSVVFRNPLFLLLICSMIPCKKAVPAIDVQGHMVIAVEIDHQPGIEWISVKIQADIGTGMGPGYCTVSWIGRLQGPVQAVCSF